MDERLKEKLYSRYENILTQVEEVLIGMGIRDKVVINTDLLELCIWDYFEDIERLKEFQEIDRVNVDKIYSYGAYWFLRRSPIQIIDDKIPQQFLHINEKVCVAITIPKMLAEMGVDAIKEQHRVESFFDLLYYNFKYRTYTQQSLELMIEAFFCGCICFSQKESA